MGGLALVLAALASAVPTADGGAGLWLAGLGKPARTAAKKPAAQRPLVPIAGTHVSLRAPAGFTPATRYPGLQQASTGASIMVTEMPGPFSQVSAGFTKEQLAARGITLLSRSPMTVSQKRGLLALVRQSAFGQVWRKWIAVFGDESQTVMVNATFPDRLEKRLSQPLRQALLSLRWNPAKPVDTLADLDFTLDPPASLKLAGRVGNMLAYTQGGKLPASGPEDALFLAGASYSQIPIADREAFARRRAAELPQVSGLKVETVAPLTVGSLPAVELTASGADPKSGEPLQVYQLIVYEPRGYHILVGMAGRTSAPQLLEEFRAAGRSFRRKPPARKPGG